MKATAAFTDLSDEVLMGQIAEEFHDRLNRGEQPEVESYVRRYPKLGGVLRQMLPALELMRAPGVDLAAEHEPSASPSFQAGCLGDYRIRREVGRGGMGVVYEAEQISLNRRVALKVLPFAAALDPKQLQRFKNEAQAAACLHHQNIVPVYGIGCERAVHFYAMQFIEGQTLAQAIADLRLQIAQRNQIPITDSAGPPSALQVGEPTEPYHPEPAAQSAICDPQSAIAPSPPVAALSTEHSIKSPAFLRTVVNLGVRAAEALEHAHQLGVIHRDIKPANLLLDGRGNLWITDFGLAHMQSQTGLTMTGDLVGTLRYMSPEQALGKRDMVDQRTDIYSLGATLYELLTLEPGFDGRDRQELLRQIAFDEPRPPRQLNKAIPQELETVVLKAMGKDPGDRYATAQELADDLERFLKDEPIRAKRPTMVQRLRKWSRRHRPVVWSTGVAGVLLLVMTVVVLAWSNFLIARERNRKDAALRELAKEAAISRAVNEFLQDDLLGQADTDKQPFLARERIGRNPNITVRELLDRASRNIEEKFHDQPLTEAAIRFTIGETYFALGRYKDAQFHLERSVHLRTTELGANHPDTLTSQNGLANAYFYQGQYARAEPLFDALVLARTATLGAQHPSTLDSKRDLACLYMALGQLPKSEQLSREVVQARTAQLGPDDLGTLMSKRDLAQLYCAQNDHAKAEPLIQEVLQAYTAQLGRDHVDTIISRGILADVYSIQSQHAKAEELILDVVRANTAMQGADHPYTLQQKVILASVYWREGQYPKAEPLLLEILKTSRATLGADHPQTLSTGQGLAMVYQAQHQYAKAEPLFIEVLKGRIAKLGVDHPDTLASREQLVQLYDAWGKKGEADAWRKKLEEAKTAAKSATKP